MAKSMQFGDLLFQFTDTFVPAWTDQHSSSYHDGSFWTPVPQASGFRPLGGLGFGSAVKGHYDSPNGKYWALCVADATDPKSGRLPAVAAPIRYDRIWTDTNTHAKTDGSCWRPIAPVGYVACGDIFVQGHDNPPATTVLWCVRKDLVHPATVGELIWDFVNSSPYISQLKFSAWHIDAPVPFVDPTLGVFSANTFVGVRGTDRPTSGEEVYVLKVPFPTEASGAKPAAPVLESYNRPESQTSEVLDHIVTVPFTAIKDDRMTLAEQVSNSPFYTIKRFACYTLNLFETNLTSLPQSKVYTVTVGVSKTQSETFSRETSITAGHETGIEIGMGPFTIGGKASGSVTKTLGFTKSTSVEEMVSASVSNTLTTAPKCAAASWLLSYSLQLFRADDTATGDPLSFKIERTFVDSEFPPPAARHDTVPPQQPRATA
jgi:hypothetical protein